MGNEKNIAILILAAGESSRMGERVKQVLPWKHTTLLGNAIEQARGSIAYDTYVVLGAFEEIINTQVSFEGVKTIQNPNWKNGLGSSIVCGIDFFIEKSWHCDGVVIMLADQPLIDTNYLNKMIGNWISDPSRIVTTQYRNRSGVPALFGKEYFKELIRLDKDFGAKDIIASNKDVILAMNPEGKEIDIDSWETYQEMIEPKDY